MELHIEFRLAVKPWLVQLLVKELIPVLLRALVPVLVKALLQSHCTELVPVVAHLQLQVVDLVVLMSPLATYLLLRVRSLVRS